MIRSAASWRASSAAEYAVASSGYPMATRSAMAFPFLVCVLMVLFRGGRSSPACAGRHRQRHAQHQQKLAPVTVPDGAGVEHRGHQAERIADRDQIKGRL